MMYRVFQQGKLVKGFDMFVDAWLFAKFELSCWSRIRYGTEVWVVNPPIAN